MSKIIRIGSSLGFIIPKSIITEYNLKKGIEIGVLTLKNGLMLDMDTRDRLEGEPLKKLLFRIGMHDNPQIITCKCGKRYSKKDRIDHACYAVEFTTEIDAILASRLLEEVKKDATKPKEVI